MVAGHAVSVAVGNHSDHEAQYAGRVRAAVDQIADEDGPSGRMYGVNRPTGGVADDRVPEVGEELFQLGATAVDVADDVERSGLVGEVIEKLGACDRDGIDLVHAGEHVHGAEALALEAAQT